MFWTLPGGSEIPTGNATIFIDYQGYGDFFSNPKDSMIHICEKKKSHDYKDS